VLVVSRFTVPPEEAVSFAARAEAALGALAACAGYLRGTLGRAADDPTRWVLVTEWAGVGAYRRALSRYEVKVAATPLLASAYEEPGAFEVLAEAPPGGPVTVHRTDRAADPDGTAHGRTDG
jgi:heme-degrading monooxygenase HmoA